MLRACFWLVLMATCTATASAQTIVVKTGDRPMMPAGTDQVRVSVAVNMFVALTDNSEQALKAQEDGRRAIYDLADRECTILRDVLATECHLESINVNVQRGQNFGQQKDGLNINGNVAFRIVPK
jgi:hypothetical protein